MLLNGLRGQPLLLLLSRLQWMAMLKPPHKVRWGGRGSSRRITHRFINWPTSSVQSIPHPFAFKKINHSCIPACCMPAFLCTTHRARHCSRKGDHFQGSQQFRRRVRPTIQGPLRIFASAPTQTTTKTMRALCRDPLDHRMLSCVKICRREGLPKQE